MGLQKIKTIKIRAIGGEENVAQYNISDSHQILNEKQHQILNEKKQILK